MKIAITGEKGFLGIQLTNYFRHILKYEVIELGKNYIEKLKDIGELDWLIHGACVHRNANPEQILVLNNVITNTTINCLKVNNINCNIVFLSTIQENDDTTYGQSKREAKEAFRNYCLQKHTKFVSFKLPNIFGKYARPYRTSFIATFCYNLHNNLQINYNQNKVKLCYIDDALKIIGNLQEDRFPYIETSVDEVYYYLLKYHQMTLNNEIPELKSKFEVNLYNTYLDYSVYKL